jgi:N4-gp56 family major capsid protein
MTTPYSNINTGSNGITGDIWDAIANMVVSGGQYMSDAVAERNLRRVSRADGAIHFNAAAVAIGAFTDASTEDLTYSGQTITPVTVSASPFIGNVDTNRFAQSASLYDLKQAVVQGIAEGLAVAIDGIKIAALEGATVDKRINARGADASIVAGDVITLATIQEAVMALKSHLRKAPRFLTQYGARFKCYLHPHVAFDLVKEVTASTGLMSSVGGAMFLNNSIGQAIDCEFIEVSHANMLNADAGDGNVDVYQTYIIGENALGQTNVEILSDPKYKDILVYPDRSALIQESVVEIKDRWHGLLYQGVAELTDTSIYQIRSSSSMGDNA